MACFADINISQGSVATYARCGGIFNMHLTANLPRMKKIINRLKFYRIMVMSLWPLFLPTLYTDGQRCNAEFRPGPLTLTPSIPGSASCTESSGTRRGVGRWKTTWVSDSHRDRHWRGNVSQLTSTKVGAKRDKLDGRR